MVEGPKRLKQKDLFLENIVAVSSLNVGQKVVVWTDFESDSKLKLKLFKGDIGSVLNIDGSGNALINFPGKNGKQIGVDGRVEGRSEHGNTMVKRCNFSNLRVEMEGTKASSEGPPGKRRKEAPVTLAMRQAIEKKAEEEKALVEKHKKQLLEITTVTEEQKGKNEAAQAFLKKEPKRGTVRYTFKDIGPLGMRFSKDIPPWILMVNDGTQAARKAPRVPVAGIVTAVNGHHITEKDCQEVMEGLKKRPVVLDVDWPVDQDLPPVNRA